MSVGKFLRGAIIQFTETFPLPIPNVIVFQFNPETMTHTLTPTRAQEASPTGTPSNPLAIAGTPDEAFSFTLVMDSNDMTTDGGPIEGALATVSGVYTRLAALEMLLFPTAPPGGGLVGSISAAIGIGGASLSGGASQPTSSVPASNLSTALFVWGPGRIVPVRVTTLTITEKLYGGTLLYPTHAEAQIGLQVLRGEEIDFLQEPMKSVAEGALKYSRKLREALALANLGNAVSDIIGMLPI